VPEEVKQDRWERFMEVAAAISAEKLRARIGQRLTVLVDALEDGGAVARSSADAPEIDGVVRIGSARGLRVGEFAEVEVTGADAYDLSARVIAGQR